MNPLHLAQQLNGKDVLIVGGASGKNLIVEDRRWKNHVWVSINFSLRYADLLFICDQVPRTEDYYNYKYGVCVEGNDVVYHLWRNHQMKGCLRCHRYCAELHQGQCPVNDSNQWLNDFHRELDTKPLTGLVAIKLMTMLQVKSIALAGFNFYIDRKGFVPYRIGCHVIPEQIEWLRKQVEQDVRFAIHDELRAILNGKWSCNEPRRVTHYDMFTKLERINNALRS